jgi:hypothetical protein
MRKTLVALTFLLCTPPAFAVVAGTDLFVPAVAHIQGAVVNGVQAQWRSDLWLFNPGTGDATVDVALLLRGQANPSPDVRSFVVGPGETRYLHDVVAETFGVAATAGALHVTSTAPVTVTGVSYDANVSVVAKGVGAAGQYFAAIPADFAIGAGAFADLVGVDQDDAAVWRSNLALVETTGQPVNLSLERLDSLGATVGSIPYHLEGFEARMVDSVVTAISPAAGSNQRIRVRVTLGSGRVVASASRVNNTTGDPSTVEMTGSHVTGRFQGLLQGAGAAELDGGIQIVLGSQGLVGFKGLAGISCGETVMTVEVASDPLQGPVPLNSDGSFSTLVSIPYSDEGAPAFVTDWTLAGKPNPDGTWSGTLLSTTHGGQNDFDSCNAIGVSRTWTVGWIGAS